MQEFVLKLVDQLGVSGFFALIVYKLLEQLLRRDLVRMQDKLEKEKAIFEARVRSLAFKHQIRYSRLHQKQAAAIAEVYRRLACVDQLCRLSLNPATALGRDESELQTQAYQAGREMFEYFDQHRIYFDADIADGVDRLWTLVGESFGRIRLYPSPANELGSHRAEYESTVPDLRRKIEAQLKGMLGLAAADPQLEVSGSAPK
jgi:hypothetical protein